ncbi:CCA-adding enzyme [compost metagenome]
MSADVDRAASLGLSLPGRYALLCRLTPEREALGRRLRVPTECNDYARLLPDVLAGLGRAQQDADAVGAQLALMERADALRKPERFADLLEAAAVLSPVDRLGWRERVAAVRGVDAGAIAKACAGDPARIKERLREARLERLRADAGAAPL